MLAITAFRGCKFHCSACEQAGRIWRLLSPRRSPRWSFSFSLPTGQPRRSPWFPGVFGRLLPAFDRHFRAPFVKPYGFHKGQRQMSREFTRQAGGLAKALKAARIAGSSTERYRHDPICSRSSLRLTTLRSQGASVGPGYSLSRTPQPHRRLFEAFLYSATFCKIAVELWPRYF